MKIKYILFFILLISCRQKETNNNTDILSVQKIQKILLEVHLAEANFEMNKSKDKKVAQNILTTQYLSIFKKYETSKSVFDTSIAYYSQRPDILEKIYSNMLNDLNQTKSSSFQK